MVSLSRSPCLIHAATAPNSDSNDGDVLKATDSTKSRYLSRQAETSATPKNCRTWLATFGPGEEIQPNFVMSLIGNSRSHSDSDFISRCSRERSWRYCDSRFSQNATDPPMCRSSKRASLFV